MDRYIILKKNLADLIYANLASLMTGKAVLWNLPFHINTGDHLIWQGEEDFIKKLRIKIYDRSGADTCDMPNLPADTTILLHGGGNFGDLYPKEHEFRLKVIDRYTSNKIIIFPQSVHYSDESKAKSDSKILSKHPDLTICARDNASFEKMIQWFPTNRVMLVPDMAFFIDDKRLRKFRKHAPDGNTLYFKRNDIEGLPGNQVSQAADSFDWHDSCLPDIMKPYSKLIQWKISCLKTRPKMSGIYNFMASQYMIRIAHRHFFKSGCKKLMPYSTIICDRLHAMILGSLLGKKIKYLDNTTGKLSAYADTWFREYPDIFQKYES